MNQINKIIAYIVIIVKNMLMVLLIYIFKKVKNPDKSLVTVEVLDGKVRQKYEKRNTAINKEEKEFLNLWEKNILNVA